MNFYAFNSIILNFINLVLNYEYSLKLDIIDNTEIYIYGQLKVLFDNDNTKNILPVAHNYDYNNKYRLICKHFNYDTIHFIFELCPFKKS